MKISDTVRALLNMTGHKQSDLLPVLGLSSRQSLNNKFSNDRWDGKDLALVADSLNCRIGFQFGNGDMLYLDPEPYKKGVDENGKNIEGL